MWAMRFEGGEDLARNLASLPARVSRRMLIEALTDAGEPMRKTMGRLAPREPGKPDIADSMVISPVRGQKLGSFEGEDVSRGEFEAAVAVGPSKGFFYGCVFDARTYISTSKGQKAICQVAVGDSVLTQAGDFRPVIATTRYPATEKPDLVTIRAAYRRGSVHTLTLTRDHKVLVFRDGKYQWIEAACIVAGDALSKRRKTSWSAGTAKTEPRACEQCGQPYIRRAGQLCRLPAGTSSGRRFCSSKCRSAWLSKHHQGMKRSDQAKAIMSQIVKARLRERPETHPNRIMAKKGYQTGFEKRVSEWLATRGIDFLPQHRVGNCYVDFYLPGSNTILEADGAFWHRDQRRDIDRDRHLLEAAPGASIVHIHFVDNRFSPKHMELAPLPGVCYVPCNPGPESYVDPVVFRQTEVLSVDHWSYRKPKGPSAMLYDLTVDGVHSFVASGLVIHNSFQEYGTSRHAAQPFMRPAFDSDGPKALQILASALWTALAGRGLQKSMGTLDLPVSSLGRTL